MRSAEGAKGPCMTPRQTEGFPASRSAFPPRDHCFPRTAMEMARTFWVLGCAAGLLAVAAGAFGAHAMRTRLPADRLAIWDTAATYQMYHAFALLVVAFAVARWPGAASLPAAGWMFAGGMLLFCGSLYLLAVTGIRWLGAVTPLGGVALLLGWALLAWGGWREGVWTGLGR